MIDGALFLKAVHAKDIRLDKAVLSLIAARYGERAIGHFRDLQVSPPKPNTMPIRQSSDGRILVDDYPSISARHEEAAAYLIGKLQRQEIPAYVRHQNGEAFEVSEGYWDTFMSWRTFLDGAFANETESPMDPSREGAAVFVTKEGLAPLLENYAKGRLKPFVEPFWTFAETAIWACTRDADQLLIAHEKYTRERLHPSVLWTDCAIGLALEGKERPDIGSEILRASRGRLVRVTACKPDGETRESVEPEGLMDVRFDDDKERSAVVIKSIAGPVFWHSPVFDSADVLAVWPPLPQQDADSPGLSGDAARERETPRAVMREENVARALRMFNDIAAGRLEQRDYDGRVDYIMELCAVSRRAAREIHGAAMKAGAPKAFGKKGRPPRER